MSSNKRIVLKFGTGILTHKVSGEPDPVQLRKLMEAVVLLKRAGHCCIVVSSGAVASGLKPMGLQERPATLAGLQACAAVGQSNLMARYDSLLRDFGMHVAQLLVTHEDLEQEGRMKNFRATLDSLSGFPQVLPVVNENDSVAIEELRYGDNDKLSAAIARIWKADLLILLTSANGLMTDATQVDGQPIPLVTDLDAVLHHADSSKTSLGSGGMASKLEAVRAATHAGIDCIIANGRRAEQIPDLVRGEGMGTRFPAVASSTSCL